MTTETLMTDTPSTEGGTELEQDAQQPATGAEEGGQQQAAKDQGHKAEGAPEKYEFKAPEGVQIDDTVIGAFSEVARELNLPQDQAQKVIDKMAPVIQARQMEQFEAARNQWAEASKADKEFGGAKLDENLAVAKKALDAFGTPELRALLNESGFGNHPEVIRVFYRAGKAISEDRFVAGQGGSTPARDARNLYSSSNMNP